ncbi:MAG: hypothetical protein JXR22_07075 [Prolixibacteraceae bacterium]|nr:hypothetical protein [Prolixibacteraceae bacterium]
MEVQLSYGINGKERKSKKGIKKLRKTIDQYWKTGLYAREYTDHSAFNNIVVPNNEDLNAIYLRMKKYGKEDIFNCSSCSYGNCFDMANSIHNGLNRIEN